MFDKIYKATEAQHAHAREAFLRVLDSAVPHYELHQLNRYPEADLDYINKEVDRLLYEPALANGGDKERKIAERLKKLSRQKDWAGAHMADIAMKAWQKILADNPKNPGFYYTRTPMKRAANKDEYDWLIALKFSAHAAKQWDKKWFAQLMLEGTPEPVADFKLVCSHLLRCANDDVSRLVQLTNVLGETSGKVLMDSKAFHSPKDFREWCLKRGSFNWGSGEKELQKLHVDVARLTAWKVVKQVVTLGWYPLAKISTPERTILRGILFYGDCARINGKWLRPDKDGIYWDSHEDAEGNLLETGYQVSDDGRENPFHQKKPMMHPTVRITDSPLVLAAMEEIGFAGQPGRAEGAPKPELVLDAAALEAKEAMLMRAFFRETCVRLQRIVGGDDALFLIGSFLSFAAAPEVFEDLSQFPGLWTHGEANSGKSTILEWLMEIWGFHVLGINLKGTNSTAVGLLQAADQYSNLPVWVDEFRDDKEQVSKDKLAVLHNSFNRAGQAKFNPSGIQRSMRTAFMVSGESTTSESAIRGRYPHVQISKHLRQWAPGEKEKGGPAPTEDFLWFQKHRHYLFFLGRYVIEHRDEFVSQVFKFFGLWSTENIDPRCRVIHGVGYASWMAMVSLLDSHTAEEVGAFKKHMIRHSRSATEDVQSDLNVHVFIQDLITAVLAGEIPPNCFLVKSELQAHAPDEPNQPNWLRSELYIQPDLTIASLQMSLRKQNASIVLKKKDLRDQLSKNEFWIKAKSADGILRKRFSSIEGEVAQLAAWGVEVDKHPLGYQRQSDAVMAEASKTLATEGDPRKGPLFALVDWILKAQKKDEK